MNTKTAPQQSLQNPMQKPIIHFAHANGVPSKTYQKLFDMLSDDFEVFYIPVLSAHKGYAIDDSWKSLIDQVIYSIESQAKGRAVIGLGHSLGSLCTFLASYKRPELFSQVIMMDPPMILGRASFIWHMAKWFSPKMVDKLSPAGKSVGRRDHWSSKQAAFDSLRSKALFKNFDDDCFAAYIEHGTIEQPDGSVTLTIPAASEVAVFRTNPHWFWLTLNRAPKVPTHEIAGKTSQFVGYNFPEILKKRTGIPHSFVEGGHMFPLEHPKQTVAEIKRVILKNAQG